MLGKCAPWLQHLYATVSAPEPKHLAALISSMPQLRAVDVKVASQGMWQVLQSCVHVDEVAVRGYFHQVAPGMRRAPIREEAAELQPAILAGLTQLESLKLEGCLFNKWGALTAAVDPDDGDGAGLLGRQIVEINLLRDAWARQLHVDLPQLRQLTQLTVSVGPCHVGSEVLALSSSSFPNLLRTRLQMDTDTNRSSWWQEMESRYEGEFGEWGLDAPANWWRMGLAHISRASLRELTLHTDNSLGLEEPDAPRFDIEVDCPELRVLTISGDEQYQHLERYRLACPSLTDIDIDICSSSVELFAAMQAAPTNLQRLTLHAEDECRVHQLRVLKAAASGEEGNCTSADQAGLLIQLLETCTPRLQQLKMTVPIPPLPKHLSALLSNMQHLRAVDLAVCCTSIWDVALACRHVEEVTLQGLEFEATPAVFSAWNPSAAFKSATDNRQPSRTRILRLLNGDLPANIRIPQELVELQLTCVGWTKHILRIPHLNGGRYEWEEHPYNYEVDCSVDAAALWEGRGLSQMAHPHLQELAIRAENSLGVEESNMPLFEICIDCPELRRFAISGDAGYQHLERYRLKWAPCHGEFGECNDYDGQKLWARMGLSSIKHGRLRELAFHIDNSLAMCTVEELNLPQDEVDSPSRQDLEQQLYEAEADYEAIARRLPLLEQSETDALCYLDSHPQVRELTASLTPAHMAAMSRHDLPSLQTLCMLAPAVAPVDSPGHELITQREPVQSEPHPQQAAAAMWERLADNAPKLRDLSLLTSHLDLLALSCVGLPNLEVLRVHVTLLAANQDPAGSLVEVQQQSAAMWRRLKALCPRLRRVVVLTDPPLGAEGTKYAFQHCGVCCHWSRRSM
ncbi:hypothetical protein WJX72_006609 [[Myrmecia] bisecta]|uniref:Uncharacterized protein n=1 Tax=[Myrmecia] bisecta TaxID=41462 RepID=A0AAW1P791_9CHLO